MAYNTGNPVEPNGSSDPRDLIDNAKIADKLINSSDLTWPGRLGKALKTWAGITQQVTDYLIAQGYESVYLVYGVGVIVQRQTQLIQRDGELYRVMNAQDIPLTLTGTWATDSPKLQAVGDAALRLALASSSGATLVHRGSSTVDEDLSKIELENQSNAERISAVSDRAESGIFGDAVMLNRVRSNISANPAIYVLGDSVSHGAFALDLYRNSWVNVLKRMINLEFGVTSYGFAPLTTLGSGGTLSQDIAQVLFTNVEGVASRWAALENATGGHVPQGLAFRSTAANDIIRSVIPCFQRRVFTWYIGQPGGGSFDIKINGVTVRTVSTAAATISPIRVSVDPLVADTFGDATIECVTAGNGPVELCGFSYVSASNTLQVENFSTSGRKLRYLDETTISSLLNGTAMMIMALGLNDVNENLSDPSYLAAFKQRIDWIIAYANLYEVPIVVPDFLWPLDASDPTRMELKRLAQETKGVYIPFPDYLKKTSGPTSNSYRTDTLKLFSDPTHPNVAGHKYIAEVIAKRIGLSCTSKKEVLDRHDWWFPLKLQSTGVSSAGRNSDTISAVRNNGPVFELRFNIDGITGSTSRGIQTAWPSRAGIQQAFASVHQLTLKTDGTSRGTFTITAGGAIMANPNTINEISTHTAFVSAPNIDHGAL